jgi:hypothetical protein
MNILVTGGTGFIGRHVIQHLLGRGDEVSVLTRDRRRAEALFQGRVHAVESLNELSAARAPEAVINLAGQNLGSGRWNAALAWDYRPLGLLAGRVDIAVRFSKDQVRGSGVVGISPGGDLHVADADVSLPVEELARAFRLPVIKLAGEVSTSVTTLQVSGQRLTEADGVLLWQQAQVIRPQALRLGDLEAVFETRDGVIEGTLRDKGGPLQLEGLVTIQADGSYELNASLASRDDTQPALSQTLRRLGRPGPDGKVSVNYSGTLPPVPAPF